MLFRLLVCLVFSCAYVCALRASESAAMASAHVDDSSGLLRDDPQAAKALETKLAEFERASGVKILARFHPKSPSPEEDAKPGVFMHALATKLGVARGGVLAVYFADEDDWRLWIGDDLTSKFAGRPGTVKELTGNDAIHNAKEALFAAAKTRSDAAFAALQQTAAADKKPTPAVRLKLHADAILDALMVRLGSK